MIDMPTVTERRERYVTKGFELFCKRIPSAGVIAACVFSIAARNGGRLANAAEQRCQSARRGYRDYKHNVTLSLLPMDIDGKLYGDKLWNSATENQQEALS